VYNPSGELVVDDFRTSTSWNIKRNQTPIVECIERRFAQFQGDIDIERMEQLQVVKYVHDQQVNKINFILMMGFVSLMILLF